MRKIHIEALRDFAIDHLPCAQSFRQNFSRYGDTEVDFCLGLTHKAVSVLARPASSAIETAAATVLLTVSLLLTKRDEALTKPQQVDLIARLASEAHELCELTGSRFPWLDALQAPSQLPPDEEEQQEAPAPAPTASIGGKFLTTDQVAEILSVKPGTVRNWARKQTGSIQPAQKVGRQYRYSGNEVLALMQSKSMTKPRGK